MTKERLAARRIDDALAEFTEYFVANYPGPSTMIHDPKWHAPKIFRAAEKALARHALESVREEALEEAARIVKTKCGACASYSVLHSPARVASSCAERRADCWPCITCGAYTPSECKNP